MARIFTTKFHFNGKIYDAIITLITNEGKSSFNVKLLDVELHELIPEGQLKFEGKEGFKQMEGSNQLIQSLMNSIASSIEHHLIATP